MKLLRYKVTNFRSVEDSGWIECDDVTTLVGINESGKSNLLLALWKLHPVNNGEIDILHDMPVSKLSVMRDNKAKEKFIEAIFSIDTETIENVYEETGYKIADETEITLKRFYDGHYSVQYSIEPILENNDNNDIDDEESEDTVELKTKKRFE